MKKPQLLYWLILAAVCVAMLELLFRITGSRGFFSKGTSFMKNYLGQSGLPRGIRNNNPGNLIITPIPWKGKIPREKNTDGKFEQFVNFAYGLRAMLLDLKNDIGKGQNTIRKLIYEFAPPHENNTVAYINTVSKLSGIGPDQPLLFTKDTMRKIVPAMARVENGIDAVSQEDFEAAWNLI